jgi:hypothetical protein
MVDSCRLVVGGGLIQFTALPCPRKQCQWTPAAAKIRIAPPAVRIGYAARVTLALRTAFVRVSWRMDGYGQSRAGVGGRSVTSHVTGASRPRAAWAARWLAACSPGLIKREQGRRSSVHCGCALRSVQFIRVLVCEVERD